jgi:hypothetical protein
METRTLDEEKYVTAIPEKNQANPNQNPNDIEQSSWTFS